MMKHATFKPNGVLTLKTGPKFAWSTLTFTGGPFDKYQDFKKTVDQPFGVCVRQEAVPNDRDVHLPIHDFDVPKDRTMVLFALKDTLQAALAGKQVYVGCMGGWGRTGLFLALIAKAVGEEDPVTFVRKNYTPHAVETPEQKGYVATFDVTPIQRWLMKEAWKTRFWSFIGR